ncbi:hypothetical protein EIN_057210 [Entamoeba invadens IP1]|uniref:hypothetical protein n=1 Tax=Entamoeba invadens IP1 TaxID=370355 RepID=UPI0002C3E123|nr:hypothetical protein EIN_057210 [Entamoeba invadens IP1]ELP93336.1 hypothetical protein EIN_057210 [Entamoeba invadens IP1]|eukprot:XP_004260107.1 hypothetical protein EIN_057210 [Entamoeba invadens IP1]
MENEFISMIITVSNQYELLVSFLESLLSLPESKQLYVTTPNKQSILTLENDMNIIFNLPFNYTKEVHLSWSADTLLNNSNIPLSRCLFLRIVSLPQFVEMLSALFLQRKVFIKSANRCLVSGALSFLTECMSPFEYTSPVISVLSESIYDLMDSPTPLLIGCYDLPPEIPRDSCLYDLDTQFSQLFTDKITLLPNSDLILESLALLRPLLKSPKHSTLECMKIHTDIIKSSLNVIHSQLSQLVANFDDFIETRHLDKYGKVSLFDSNSFVETCDEDAKPFMKEFTQTLIFNSFIDNYIDNIDGFH